MGFKKARGMGFTNAWAVAGMTTAALLLGARAQAAPPPAAAWCSGEYADDYAGLSARAREFEQHHATYTYCVRTTAVYECPFYGQDGSLHRTRKKVVAHGTAFGYRQQNGETWLLTNQHVAEWPAVSDEEHPVEDVPAGCKRVSDVLRVVDNEADEYERDDIALQRVVTDPQMDVAVLKARATLPILPWKIGHSAGLHDRNVVDVRGFPLGAFKATNVGKVVSAYDHDDDKDWDHDDFVVDALLSPGNSGSPVLAISCKTGEFELVGIYHAGYLHGSALNVVVGIDQVRDLMTTLKRTARRADGPAPLDAQARALLQQSARAAIEPYFALGGLTAAVRPRGDGALVFEVLDKDFPFDNHAIAAIEDLPPVGNDAFGTVGRVWLGNRRGLKTFVRTALDAEAQALVQKLVEALRRDAVQTFAWHAAEHRADSSREHFQHVERMARAVRKAATARKELAQSVTDLAERLAPRDGEATMRLADALAVPDAAVVQAAPAGPGPDTPPKPVSKSEGGSAGKASKRSTQGQPSHR